MSSRRYVPHVDMLLRSLRITKERLNSKSKIAIDTELLREILGLAVGGLPFSAKFYTGTYADIADAHSSGKIADLRRHMTETGYYEGRMGSPPLVDEAFYVSRYPDVGAAIESGAIADATEHYIRAGAAEGRIPRPALQDEINHWNRILLDGRATAA